MQARFNFVTLWALFALASASAQTLEVPGAGPPEQLLRRLAEVFNERHAPARVEVPPSSGSAGALDAVKSGRAPLARLPRRLSAEEERQGLKQTTIAREAIVFATGGGVTVSGLSRAQLVDVFSGKVANWSEVGGKPAPIRVLYREETEGLLRHIRGQLAEFASLKFTPDGRLLNRDYEVIAMLNRFDWAVSWASLGNARAGKGLRVLALDGVVPGPETLRSGQYPLHYEVTLIYKEGALTGLARQFSEFAASPEGRQTIEALGALPMQGR